MDLALDPQARALLFTEARTANAFTDEPVTDAQLRAIHELVKWAPTSFNMQPLRVLALRSPEARERLLPLMKRGNREKTERAPLAAILAVDTEFHLHLNRLQPFRDDPAASWTDPEERARKGGFNATIQIGYFILGVRAAGLAAGPMIGFDADAVDREFFPDGRLRSLVVMNIGTPSVDAYRPRLPRLEFEDVFDSV